MPVIVSSPFSIPPQPLQGTQQGSSLTVPKSGVGIAEPEGITHSGTQLIVAHTSSGADPMDFYSGFPAGPLSIDSTFSAQNASEGLATDGSNLLQGDRNANGEVLVHTGFTSAVSNTLSFGYSGGQQLQGIAVYNGDLYVLRADKFVVKHTGITTTVDTSLDLSTVLSAETPTDIAFDAVGNLVVSVSTGAEIWSFEGFTSTARAGFGPLNVSGITGGFAVSAIEFYNGELLMLAVTGPAVTSLFRMT